MRQITVRSRDFAGQVKKSWTAELIRDDGDLIELFGVFDVTIEHLHLGRIPAGMLSYEYYWHSRWYNVFRFHEPDGTFRGFYCNVNMPPALNGNALDYVDLDLDVIVSKSGEILVVDEDEFRASAERYDYPLELKISARQAVNDIQKLIGLRQFPFDLSNSMQQ